MLINDNLSVALALAPHVGLHIGQSDLPVSQARALLGPDRLLGISVHSVEQARDARTSGADYAGVGPIYGTQSKAGIVDDDVLGARQAAQIIEALDGLPAVLIGGLNQQTAARALFGASSPTAAPAGIAVISAIMARKDTEVAASELAEQVAAFKASRAEQSAEQLRAAFGAGSSTDVKALVERSALLLSSLRNGSPPLIQTLTSHVSSTLSANVTLALGGSPIMSAQEAEADDLGKVTGAVVLNIGTIGAESRRGMKAVGSAANRGRKVNQTMRGGTQKLSS
jgi:thiamine-phosphate diphosphorylase/hydroxyethylthiazole kinase